MRHNGDDTKKDENESISRKNAHKLSIGKRLHEKRSLIPTKSAQRLTNNPMPVQLLFRV